MRFGPTPFCGIGGPSRTERAARTGSAKQALEAEVLQKNFLLKEVNHRIKNSLQIVSSILYLQRSHTENEEAIKALQNASARVIAVAAVHERLYTGSDIRVVP